MYFGAFSTLLEVALAVSILVYVLRISKQNKQEGFYSTELPYPEPSHPPYSSSSDVRSPTSTSTEVTSPTSTSTEVRSPTSTSTDAYTQGNVTVTGGAGAGATTSVFIGCFPEQLVKRADDASNIIRSKGSAERIDLLMKDTGAPRVPGPGYNPSAITVENPCACTPTPTARTVEYPSTPTPTVRKMAKKTK